MYIVCVYFVSICSFIYKYTLKLLFVGVFRLTSCQIVKRKFGFRILRRIKKDSYKGKMPMANNCLVIQSDHGPYYRLYFILVLK